MALRIGLAGASLIAMLAAFEPVVAADDCAAQQKVCKLDCENRSSNMRMSFGDAVCTQQCIRKIAACKTVDPKSSGAAQTGMPNTSGAPAN